MHRRRLVGATIGMLFAGRRRRSAVSAAVGAGDLAQSDAARFFCRSAVGLRAPARAGAARGPFDRSPLVIATGLPFAVLARLGWAARGGISGKRAADLKPRRLRAGRVMSTDWRCTRSARRSLPRSCIYTAVIVLLPRASRQAAVADRRALAQSRPARCRAASGGVRLALLFVLDYRLARQLTRSAALAHGWIEIPILLLAWAGSPPLSRRGRIEESRAGRGGVGDQRGWEGAASRAAR